MNFKTRIIEIRKNKSMTQEDLADLLRVTRQTISNWENGKSYPDIISLLEISKKFDVSLDDLLKNDQKIVKNIINKEKNKKILKIITIILSIIVALITIYLIFKPKEEKAFEVAVNYNLIEATKQANCVNESILYYKDNNRIIYFNCLDTINLIVDNNSYELKEYLKTNKLTIDWFINLFIEKEIYNGKHKLYSDIKNQGWYGLRYKQSKDKLKIIECNSTDNNNVYIGSEKMTYNAHHCEKVN